MNGPCRGWFTRVTKFVFGGGVWVFKCFVVWLRATHVCFFVLVSFRPVSASSLHTLRCFQVWSINPVVCGGPYPSKRVRILVLE